MNFLDSLKYNKKLQTQKSKCIILLDKPPRKYSHYDRVQTRHIFSANIYHIHY